MRKFELLRYLKRWMPMIVLFFVIMTAGYEIYFRITGKKYDGLLGERQKKS